MWVVYSIDLNNGRSLVLLIDFPLLCFPHFESKPNTQTQETPMPNHRGNLGTQSIQMKYSISLPNYQDYSGIAFPLP